MFIGQEISKMDIENEESILKDFVPRDYQLELLEDVKKSNTILYLPTGSGKTYIATMLVKYMGEPLNKPLGEGRKWTFFIVHSVPLVNQQANSLRKHLPWNIGTFTGDMNVDFWSKNEWKKILEECHIMVMTAQIYLNNLHHGFMNIKDANLIIFDECHHAVLLHPFRQIMQVVHDTNFNDDKRPHILGLTATLINSKSKNVKEELTRLQQTFSATIKTKYDEAVKIFSARPEEFILLYDEFILDEDLKAILNRIKLFYNQLKDLHSSSKNEPIIENQDTYYLEVQKSPIKSLANYFLDLEVNLGDSGVYVAYLATWHYIIDIEKKKKLCCDLDKYMILTLALSNMTVIRKMLYDYMIKNSKSVESPLSLVNNASSKLKSLMELLSSIKRSDICLIFVDRRTTAKVIYHYIKDYIHEHKQTNIVCEFIVGAKGIFHIDSREMMYKKLQNNDILKKFNDNLINVLITSEVLEEGVDIQTCNYVIRYDTPKNFPSYVQSKGRARSKDSKFVVMVPKKEDFNKIKTVYDNMEKEIDKILVNNDIDDDNNEEDLDQVFKTKHAILTHDIAISIVNRYCYSLPQDRFSNLGPDWYIAENDNDFKKYKLILPINSAIKTPINGIFCRTKKNAKKSAAFNACIELYKAKALDEQLLPVNIANKFLINNLKWFPHWVEEDMEACKYNLKPGTNKMKRIVHIESPSYLKGVYPQVDKPSYLHVIHCVPMYSQLKDSNYGTFDKLLRSNKEFGILTSKKIPLVSNFPIFLNFGEVNIQIKENIDVIYLDHKNRNRLEQFHNKLFLDVLSVKDFIVRNYNNENNSYMIVPIICTDNTYSVDWNVVDLNIFVETKPPTMSERKDKFYEEYLEMSNVISPWYRNIVPLQRYIVTDVYYDMTPESCFPTSEYETYKTYFSDKYNIQVTNENQPMIKVKSLGVSKINYLIPKFTSGKIDKRSEYIEILIPEFCIWHRFPSIYWLKALMLPTILYRFSNLLLAAELLEKVNSLCNIKLENKTNDTVKMDNFCGFNEEKKKKNYFTN